MSRGIGQKQMRVLAILEEGGGALTTAGLLAGLGDQAGDAAGYSRSHASLFRSVRGLRDRDLVKTYRITVSGHNALIIAITSAGAELLQGIEWE